MGACYNMSLKDFEHFGVHDLFNELSALLEKAKGDAVVEF